MAASIPAVAGQVEAPDVGDCSTGLASVTEVLVVADLAHCSDASIAVVASAAKI